MQKINNLDHDKQTLINISYQSPLQTKIICHDNSQNQNKQGVDYTSSFDIMANGLDESQPLRVNKNLTNVPQTKLIMNVSPPDKLTKNQQKQNIQPNSNRIGDGIDFYENCQNENDSHKSNSKRKIKRSFTTMADAALAATLNGDQDHQLILANLEENSEISKKNSNRADEQRNCQRLSISTQGTFMTAEGSRDSISGGEAMLSCLSNDTTTCFLGNNRLGLKTKGKENVARFSMPAQINGPIRKKPSSKKNMEDMPAPKMYQRKLTTVLNGQILNSDYEHINRQKIKNTQIAKTQALYQPSFPQKTQKILELPLKLNQSDSQSNEDQSRASTANDSEFQLIASDIQSAHRGKSDTSMEQSEEFDGNKQQSSETIQEYESSFDCSSSSIANFDIIKSNVAFQNSKSVLPEMFKNFENEQCGPGRNIQLLKKHQSLFENNENRNQNLLNVNQDHSELQQIHEIEQNVTILSTDSTSNVDILQVVPQQSSDRYIPQRISSSNDAIFQISQQISKENDIITQYLKINKKQSSSELPSNQASVNQIQQQRRQAQRALQQRQSQGLNDRGLTQYRLRDAVHGIIQAQDPTGRPAEDDEMAEEIDQSGVAPSSQQQNASDSQQPNELHQSFNDALRRSLVNTQPHIPQQPHLPFMNASSMSDALSQQAGPPQYSNIFGGTNSYDQVMTQVNQNIQSSMNRNGISEQDEILNVVDQNKPLLHNQPNMNSMRNHAQEEKDDELMKNISNYSNLLEQQLLLEKNESLTNIVDSTPASNIVMTNLSDQDNGIPKNQFDKCQDKENNENGKDSQNSNSMKMATKSISQKSLLGSKVLKFGKHNSEPLQTKVKKQTFEYNFNNRFMNCEQMFINAPLINIGEQSKPRKIAPNPFRILDAPGLQDDFYLNLVDWSAQNILAVALESSVYVWNATTSTVQELCDIGDDDQVTSLSWSQSGGHLSVGTKYGQLKIWDINSRRQVRSLDGHTQRVSSLAWNNVTPSVVASGSKDKSILVRDLRASNQSYMRLTEHRQEVCGMRWSLHDENQLASGGNDNKLFIWSATSDKPLQRFSDHQAAVKAINWSPLHRGLLATGGGTADQCIRFWNTLNLTPLNCINTGSQVCNLVFSKTNDELVSTHGYSLNQVIVWKYPTMEKLATLTGHTFRVLYLAMNPDGSSIVTGAGDETLRFWNVFPKARSSKCGYGANGVVGSGSSSLFPSSSDFR